VFLSLNGKPRTNISHAVGKLCKEYIGMRVTAHGFRHLQVGARVFCGHGVSNGRAF
jgi:hypothetical protein